MSHSSLRNLPDYAQLEMRIDLCYDTDQQFNFLLQWPVTSIGQFIANVLVLAAPFVLL